MRDAEDDDPSAKMEDDEPPEAAAAREGGAGNSAPLCFPPPRPKATASKREMASAAPDRRWRRQASARGPSRANQSTTCARASSPTSRPHASAALTAAFHAPVALLSPRVAAASATSFR